MWPVVRRAERAHLVDPQLLGFRDAARAASSTSAWSLTTLGSIHCNHMRSGMITRVAVVEAGEGRHDARRISPQSDKLHIQTG
ncbi:hypothetical protein QFZ53_001484 [Microbacterium natoriense]|uniref:Uncharacterized protein n=1 Tax=Microbacterium natoriense TaxID=284570 RepID=A0AAW8EVP3_9MICO|nr:hypothetical protein [Microbacterium natoriense]MDQ0647288.1 hypothetical protein [Microbacterium natoriense]